MPKFQTLLFLAPVIATGYAPRRAGEFYDSLNHPDVLSSIVDEYDQPVGQMCQLAAENFFNNGPKPEWLTHAGL